MKNVTLTILVATALPGLAVAQEQTNYQCSHGDLKRRVEIVYETGVTVPCEVHYYKDTEAPGEQQVLWRALNQEGYCEQKTGEFVRQLASWGWTCAQAESSEEATAPEEAAAPEEAVAPDMEDDTEALAPEVETDEVGAT